MGERDLGRRTADFALAAAFFARTLGADAALQHAARQLIRASASVAANYRLAGLARSRKEFIARLGVVIEEADESVYWLEYIDKASQIHQPAARSLRQEGQQIL